MRLKAACVMLLLGLMLFPASVWAQSGVRSAASKARGEYGRVGGSTRTRSASPAMRPISPMAAPQTGIARSPSGTRVYSYQPGTRAVVPAPTYRSNRSGTWYCPPGMVPRSQR